MKKMWNCCVLAFVVVAMCSTARAEENADPLTIAFEKLKAMRGEWTIEGDACKDMPKNAKIVYKVVAGGSVVMETTFPGTKMEMISMYHRDGKRLVMTHYCMAKNQPRFQGAIDPKTGDLVLHFVGGTNLDVKKDMHVHNGRIRFESADRVTSSWAFWAGGKQQGVTKFTLKRVK